MEEQDPIAKKKAAQHRAWRKWYDSEKGKAYRLRYRQRAKELRATRAEAK